ncbi:FecR domain-containing protein [Halalkalibaculum sp. DA3122]|uniref:FecR family protein n=1 Tax=unclassified Halalkalibaculum TaxID=2964617 RepID=UPI0037540E54
MTWNKLTSMLGWPLAAFFIAGLASAEMYNYTSADRPLAFVRRFKPEVNILPKQIEPQKGEPLYSGDTLRTYEEGYAAVQFMDKSFAKVKPNSELTVRGEVNNDKSTSARIALEAGEIFMEVTQRSDNNFEVATSKSVASVKGTNFGVRSDNYAWVEEGIVEFMSTETGQTVSLTERMYGQVNEDNSITTGELTEDELQSLRSGYDELDGDTGAPKQMRLRFRDENGEIREIQIEYYDNSDESGTDNENE